MHGSHLHYFPNTGPFLLILFLLFVVLLVLVQLGVLEYAYSKIGLQPRWAFLLLFVSLLGSYVNIPVAQIGPKKSLQTRWFPIGGSTTWFPRKSSPRQ